MLIEAVAAGQEISKSTIWNTEISSYKLSKIAAVKEELKQVPTLLDEPNDVLDTVFEKSVKKQTTAKEKKSTYELTLELIEQGKDVAEIASTRQVSKQTINNHFVYLIRSEQIQLTDVLSSKRINELESMFEGFTGTSLGPLKEKLGSKATWDELKLYQAYAQLQ